MTDNQAANQRSELSAALLQMNEQIAPILDNADGMRVEMERRGWSPTAAEQVALQWLRSALTLVMKS